MEKVQRLLEDISNIRSEKYKAEVERQKHLIESALIAFLENKKKDYEELEKATEAEREPAEFIFEYVLDVAILSEVKKFIDEEFDLLVDVVDKKKVVGIFEG